ncbi:MAG TPA: aromatic ring-hydroxylating dioxygenase subunit alpha [Ktedonobacterales bacterium]|nr:aromatic ring-hydroxylating dioxygenase subunit alpha [Ktedonobacterales bacterium]
MTIRTKPATPTAPASPGMAALERGETLPASWYTDPAFYAREQERIFRRSWQYVGLAEQVARPGDFFTARAGDVPIVVARDQQGALRGYVNVCRHRGSQLVNAEQGNRATLQCAYHAWTYDLDGSLRAAPGMRDEPEFDKACYALVPVQVEAWGPFIFANPDCDAPPLASVLGELPAMVNTTGLRLDAIRRKVRRTYDIAANWKVVVDNYLECYHCPVAHPGFSDLIDLKSYAVAEYEYFSTQAGPPTKSAREGKAGLYDISGDVDAGFYAFLWPNFTLNIYPGPGNVSLNLFLPVDTNRTLAVYDYCFSDAVPEQEIAEFTRFIDQVQEEDVVLCESVQRGLRSGFFDRGRLMQSERMLAHFQKLVYRFLADADEAEA